MHLKITHYLYPLIFSRKYIMKLHAIDAKLLVTIIELRVILRMFQSNDTNS